MLTPGEAGMAPMLKSPPLPGKLQSSAQTVPSQKFTWRPLTGLDCRGSWTVRLRSSTVLPAGEDWTRMGPVITGPVPSPTTEMALAMMSSWPPLKPGE